MRHLIAAALLASALSAAGCAASPSTRVPEVVTVRTVETAPAGETTGAAREHGAEREVVAPHVDERDDEGAEDTAPQEDQ